MNATQVRISTRGATARSLQAHLSRLLRGVTREDILSIDLRYAKDVVREFAGLRSDPVIHTYESAKLDKSAKFGRPTLGLTLLPATASGVWNTCPWASAGCTMACLNTSGHGGMQSAQDGRMWKTLAFGEIPLMMLRLMFEEISAFSRKLGKVGMRGAWRGGITSDLDWTKVCPALLEHIAAELGEDAAYDYTKDVSRFKPREGDSSAVAAYRRNLTFSASEETSDEYLVKLLTEGTVPRIAVVFAARVANKAGRAMRPTSYLGIDVVNADEHDYRPADGTGVFSGLLAKDVTSCSFAEGVASGFFRQF